MANPKRPFAAIIGGSKVSTKIGVIESLLGKVDMLLLGGGMIFTFYKAQGLPVGSSLVEEDKLDLATSLLEKAKAKGVSLLLPSDVVVADKFAADANTKVSLSPTIHARTQNNQFSLPMMNLEWFGRTCNLACSTCQKFYSLICFSSSKICEVVGFGPLCLV